MKKYRLENVTSQPDLWSGRDPVRPELGVKFKTAPGRGVFGLVNREGSYKAFLCFARTTDVPRTVSELKTLTSESGEIIIPYTVWSNEKGAGREIVNEVIKLIGISKTASRVVTLSPLTEMARKFHIRNNASEFRINESTVNFEYEVV